MDFSLVSLNFYQVNERESFKDIVFTTESNLCEEIREKPIWVLAFFIFLAVMVIFTAIYCTPIPTVIRVDAIKNIQEIVPLP